MEKAVKTGIAGFFTREYKRMVNFVRQKLVDGSSRDAEDIVQDVMLRLYESADLNIPLEKLSSYIYTAIRNRIVDMMRKRKDDLSLDEVSQDNGLSLLAVLRSKETADGGLESKEFMAAFHYAMGTLSEEEREVVIATEFEDISFRELVEEWDEPIGTLLSRKARAVEKIKNILLKGGISHA